MNIHIPDHTTRDLIALADENAELDRQLKAGVRNDLIVRRAGEVREALADAAMLVACHIRIKAAVQLAEQQLGLRGAA